VNSFWAYRWMDAHGVKTMKRARATLSDKVALNHLHELAAAQTRGPRDDQVELVAGRGIDLSGHLDCNASECRKRQVDNLLRHAWHYFDRILVADGLSHEVSHHWDPRSAKLKEWLVSHIEVPLYLRSIGAEDLVVFHEKPPPCQVHLARHAAEAGLPTALDSDQTLLGELADAADVRLQRKQSEIHYAFTHPQFEHTVWGEIEGDGSSSLSDRDLRRAVAKDVVQRYVAHLSSDAAIAHQATAPLGSIVWLHGRLLRQSASRITPAEVVFNLDLPVLNKVPIDTLLKIRRDDGDAFERFRASLRKAVTERLREGSSDGGRLAEDIRRDVIEPELVQVRQRLASAERALSRKALVGFGLGSIVTVCGLLAGVPAPLAVTGGIGIVTTVAATAGLKDIDERRDVSLSDMYFLWKALRHARHRR